MRSKRNENPQANRDSREIKSNKRGFNKHEWYLFDGISITIAAVEYLLNLPVTVGRYIQAARTNKAVAERELTEALNTTDQLSNKELTREQHQKVEKIKQHIKQSSDELNMQIETNTHTRSDTE